MSQISVVMGSKSDWPTVKEACQILDQFGVDYNKNVISAHRMPDEMFAFAKGAVANGTKVIIACAGGAKNAALLALQILGITDQQIQDQIVAYRKQMHDQAAESGAHLD